MRRFPHLRPLTAGLAGFALLAGAVQAAAPSSFSESRGYQSCANAAAGEAHIIRLDSRYFIYEHDDAKRFYLNGYAFRNGDSERVKIACDTTGSGNRVLAVSVDAGSYAGRLVEAVEVAQN